MREDRGPSRLVLRRTAATMLALLLFASLAVTGVGASTKAKLSWATRRLHDLERQIHYAHGRLSRLGDEIQTEQQRRDALQDELNALAGRLSTAQGAYQATVAQIHEVRVDLRRTRARYESLRDQIDLRARELYMGGPGSALDVLLAATSIRDLSARLEFVNSLELSDISVANQAQVQADRLEIRKADLERLRERLAVQLARLREQQAALSEKFREQEQIVDRLADKEAEVRSIQADLADRSGRISGIVERLRKQLSAEQRAAAAAARREASTSHVSFGPPSTSGDGPFFRCPVGDPHAYSDSFGAPRYTGGYHPHAGNDILAPRGTPIYAPFPGHAYADPNGLGGNAVIVSGAQGYVYNAHLDHYGTLGTVSTGTVIGYVGDSGDAQGGPTHDHFEWHPNSIPPNPYRSSYGYTVIGSAVDPYPYLNEVC